MDYFSRFPGLRPKLARDFVLIGPRPDIPKFVLPPNPPECVDHHVFRGLDGAWHLWGCIRGTAIGRILYHWEGERLDQGSWKPTGEIIRPDRTAGESIADWEGQEWIQSPFIVKDNGLFYFFYGGHSTGADSSGREVPPEDPSVECQICLMTSTDGRSWNRYRNELYQSRLFTGPGEARDPCVLRIEGAWYMYYAGHESGNPLQPGIYLRKSTDLIHWSPPKLVHRNHQLGMGKWTHECPHVVQRGDHYYLFRTEDYDRARTHIFWSDDPTDFGVDQTGKGQYLGTLPLAAPEVIVDEQGDEYITSCHDLQIGIKICRLTWI
jgi:sucrose-6-phosphate hydrolase SacC (GH32 family)